MGLRSGLLPGHSMSSMLSLPANLSFTTFDPWHGDPSWNKFVVPCWLMKKSSLSSRTCLYLVPFIILPGLRNSRPPLPLQPKQPQIITLGDAWPSSRWTWGQIGPCPWPSCSGSSGSQIWVQKGSHHWTLPSWTPWLPSGHAVWQTIGCCSSSFCRSGVCQPSFWKANAAYRCRFSGWYRRWHQQAVGCPSSDSWQWWWDSSRPSSWSSWWYQGRLWEACLTIHSILQLGPQDASWHMTKFWGLSHSCLVVPWSFWEKCQTSTAQ